MIPVVAVDARAVPTALLLFLVANAVVLLAAAFFAVAGDFLDTAKLGYLFCPSKHRRLSVIVRAVDAAASAWRAGHSRLQTHAVVLFAFAFTAGASAFEIFRPSLGLK